MFAPHRVMLGYRQTRHRRRAGGIAACLALACIIASLVGAGSSAAGAPRTITARGPATGAVSPTLAGTAELRTAPVPAPPIISNVTVTPVSARQASIEWDTDTPADTQIHFGFTTDYGEASARDRTQVTHHVVQLTALVPDQGYHVQVLSAASSGRQAASGDVGFHTQVASPRRLPLIVDTDMFSDADDVGALAIAFAMQKEQQAQLIAVGVDTRTSRPAVANDSWKCVAAIAHFYGDDSLPIGSSQPLDGTAVNTVDFIHSCANFAPATTPRPQSAVAVYRRALAAQPDHSVVIAAIGYSNNLSALLHSSPDAASPLSGMDLVAKKVRFLSIMGGGYPSRAGENNLIGDPSAAQDVAANWPTPVDWSGYEVGDAVHTGQTISSVHPANSPVRAAYEAYVGPNNWIFSYDLTAVYHAVWRGDYMLRLGPLGENSVGSDGSNAFTVDPSGTQRYLVLKDTPDADSAIETLLDVRP